jgi:hypothetical protein
MVINPLKIKNKNIFSELLLSVPYSLLIIPAVTYSKAKIQKKLILNENKGKSGIYR